MIEIRPGMHGDELPTLTDVTQEDIDFYLDPETKDVPELMPDPGAAERERLEGIIRDGDEAAAAMAKVELVVSHLFYRDRSRARDLASEVAAVAQRIGDPLLLAESHHAFAQANNRWGMDSQMVASHALEAEYLYHDVGKPYHEALMIWFRMLAALNRSAWSAAADLAQPIFELLKEPGDTGDVFRFSVYARVYSLLRVVAVGAGSPLDLLRRCVVLAVAYSRAGEFPLWPGGVPSERAGFGLCGGGPQRGGNGPAVHSRRNRVSLGAGCDQSRHSRRGTGPLGRGGAPAPLGGVAP